MNIAASTQAIQLGNYLGECFFIQNVQQPQLLQYFTSAQNTATWCQDVFNNIDRFVMSSYTTLETNWVRPFLHGFFLPALNGSIPNYTSAYVQLQALLQPDVSHFIIQPATQVPAPRLQTPPPLLSTSSAPHGRANSVI
jgi:hypothetical protein